MKVNKRGIVWDQIGYWLLALFLLAVLVGSYILLKQGGLRAIGDLLSKLKFWG